MEDISKLRLNLLRAMYLLIAVGLSLSILPEVFDTTGRFADSDSVVNAILTTFILLSLVGLRFPLKMIPILILELVWKLIWLLVFALPMHLNQGLDEYAVGVAFACGMGVVLTPIVIPWGYVIKEYVLGRKI